MRRFGATAGIVVFAIAEITTAAEPFPIGFWYGPPASANTLQTWRVVADAGFTVAGPCYPYSAAENRRMLDFCRQVGLKAIVVDGRVGPEMVRDATWRETVRAVVDDYGRHPALYGYHLADEPHVRWFPALGEIRAEFRREDPQHFAFINLYPSYASHNRLGAPTYRDYVARYAEAVRPEVFCYDHYAFLKGGDDRDDYFDTLQAVRSAALKAGKPMWSIVLAMPHERYRDPTAAELRWQVYTALAYGAKGLFYFTYWPPTELADEALVDQQGRPTRRYQIVRELNGEVSAVGGALLPLRSSAIYHTGSIPAGATRLPTDFALQPPEGAPLVVGSFVDKADRQYVLLVNRSYEDAQEISLAAASYVTAVARFDPASGDWIGVPIREQTIRTSLDPGAGRLLALKSTFVEPEPMWPSERIHFDFKQDEEGWIAEHDLAELSAAEGVLRGRITGRDPYFTRMLLAVPADRYRKVIVRMKVPHSKIAQLFWQTAAEPTFSDERHVSFRARGDDQFHEYSIELGDHLQWRDQEIRALRLDPAVEKEAIGKIVEIDWIRAE